MPYTVAFDAARKRVTITVVPPISEHDAHAGLREARSRPEFRADYAIVIDLLAADQPPSATGAVQLGEILKASVPGHKVAILWPHPPTTTLAFVQITASPTVELRLFKGLGEAEAWLSV